MKRVNENYNIDDSAINYRKDQTSFPDMHCPEAGATKMNFWKSSCIAK